MNKCVSVVTLPTAIPVHVNSFTSRFKGSNRCVNSTGRSGDDILISTSPDIKLALKVMILSTASALVIETAFVAFVMTNLVGMITTFLDKGAKQLVADLILVRTKHC